MEKITNQTIKIMNAVITLSITAGMVSLTMVEAQPLVLAFTSICVVVAIIAWKLRLSEEADLRDMLETKSRADEDRPE